MKVRIKFRKQGSMKFIGHLDIMRYFQKAIRRAQIDIAFSEGFSPHMIMSFAAPLGVGLTSDGEYFDIEMRSALASQEAVRRLNEVMAEGMEVLSFVEVEEGKKNNGMALVAGADYSVRFRPGYEPEEGWEGQLVSFAAQEEIRIWKKTKKSEKEVDIKPMIHQLAVADQSIRMRLATGSASNLKPELVMDAFCSFIGHELHQFSLEVNRVEMLAQKPGGKPGEFCSLEDLGKEIVSDMME